MHNWLSRLESDMDSIYYIVKHDGYLGHGHMLNDKALHEIRQLMEKLISDVEEVTKEEIQKRGKQ